MVISGVPPIRLLSNIDCTSNCDGTTFGQSYYILIDLTKEMYQYSIPVTWSPDTRTLTLSINIIFGTGSSGILLDTKLNKSIAG